MTKVVAIVDYGMGNIHSVKKALELFGAKTSVATSPEEIRRCLKLVLPGVGAFSDAMQELRKKGLIPAIREHIQNKKIFLGICLGMQLLFEESQEAEGENGLGIFKGRAVRFTQKGLKVPHMGWNQLNIRQSSCPLLKDIKEESSVYFCHSYYPEPEQENIVAAHCHYGLDFAAVIWQENIFGVQFHPEKSQAKGLEMLKNFVNL